MANMVNGMFNNSRTCYNTMHMAVQICHCVTYMTVVNFSPSFVFNWSSSNGPSHDLHEHHVIPVGNNSYSLCSYLKSCKLLVNIRTN